MREGEGPAGQAQRSFALPIYAHDFVSVRQAGRIDAVVFPILDRFRLMQHFPTRTIYVLVTLLGLCMPCSADAVSRIDLRSEGAEPIDYYVVICARESEPWGAGHTFVVFVQQDRRTGEVRSQGFGFYPQVEKVVVRLFTGNGAVRDESTKSASIKPWLLTHRLIVQVDRDAFEAGLNVKEQWVAPGIDYHLLKQNCTHFAYDVMKAIQLGAPEPKLGERPSLYVGRLLKLDLGRNRAGQERLPATFVNGQQ